MPAHPYYTSIMITQLPGILDDSKLLISFNAITGGHLWLPMYGNMLMAVRFANK
jgi:hypothetical protein